MPNEPAENVRRITVQANGPMLVEGPVEVALEDGTLVRSDRFCVALCTCRRSRRFPWCDTSHRRRTRPGPSRSGEAGEETPNPDS
ncbi:CDGSH iron-sulfur domain-containing protein [Streptomyces sp. NPDC056527]|uniref:CDGSH iron-sulfur domain-containing protein n=1 Tax=Streptomyces sp. NPDC056527 TaxID=3345853 RepID=UPI0036A72983